MGKYNKGASTNLIHIVSDCFFGILAYILSMLIAGENASSAAEYYFVISIIFIFIFLLSNKESRLYNVTTFFYADRIIRFISKSFLIATAVVSTMLFYVGRVKIDGVFYISFLLLAYVLMILSAFLVRYFIKRSNKFAPRTLLVGEIDRFGKFERYLDKGNTDLNRIGYVSMMPTEDDRYLGCMSNLEELIHDYAIDQIYVMHRKDDDVDIQHYIDLCIAMGVTFRLIMNEYKGHSAQSYVSSVGTYPVMTYHTVSLNMSSRALKRIMDIIGSICGIVISSPIMLVTAILIKLDSPGPVIFKQERVGQNGRHFFMYKFRSMCTDAETLKKKLMEQNEVEGGFMFKIHDDPRITRIGKIIRKLSIDELPQFFNVFLGDMSLVGTRPPTLDEVDRYEVNHWRRMSIKPGITGMWQVSGRSSITDFDEIVQLDTEYIDKWNLLMDIRILILTVLQVFRHDGNAC